MAPGPTPPGIRALLGMSDRSRAANRVRHCGADRGHTRWRRTCAGHAWSAASQGRRRKGSEVPRRTLSRLGGVAGVCRKSVGTVADASALAGPAGRLSTKRSDVSAGHGRVDTRRHHLDEIRVSYGSEGWGFESLRARLQMCSLTCADLLIPCPSAMSQGCPAVCISYRRCCRGPAKWAPRGDSGVRRVPFGPSCADASDLLSHLDV